MFSEKNNFTPSVIDKKSQEKKDKELYDFVFFKSDDFDDVVFKTKASSHQEAIEKYNQETGTDFWKQKEIVHSRLDNEPRKYVYTDHSGDEDKVVFEVIANSIMEADKEYEKATGHNSCKQSYVGCSVIKPEKE